MGFRHVPLGIQEFAMIEISLEWLAFACLLTVLVGILFVWVGYEFARRRRERQAVRLRLRCRVCCMDFEDRGASELAVCPRCGALNERVSPRVF